MWPFACSGALARLWSALKTNGMADGWTAHNVAALQRRLNDLWVLKETMARNSCFDAEDIGWVEEEAQAVAAKIEVLTKGRPAAAPQPPQWNYRRDQLNNRVTVLSAIDQSTECLSKGELGRKLAEKQRRLQEGGR